MKNVLSVCCVSVAAFFAFHAGPLVAQTSEGAKAEATKMMENSKSARFAALDKYEMTLTFDKGKYALTADDKAKLDELVKADPLNKGRIKLTIAAWSDKPYPVEKKSELGKNDRKLATERIDSVVAYLKPKVKFDGIEKVNMAQRANTFAVLFSNDDAKVKAAFEGYERDKPWISYEAKKFRENGGPSKVVLVMYDKMGLGD